MAERYKKLEEEHIKMEEKHNKLEEKHNKLVAELKSKVECPVCLAIPNEGPMASCPKGHLVCVPCQQTMLTNGQLACPNCREPMGKTRSLLAKTVIENIEHECSNEGCGKKIGREQACGGVLSVPEGSLSGKLIRLQSCPGLL